MNSKSIAIFLTAASLAFAQGQHGPQQANPPRMGVGLDLTKLQTVEGAVSAINIGFGSQYPSIQVNQTTIKVAPVWYLIEHDFEIKPGDTLKITAAPSLQARDPYLIAVTITNTKSNVTLTLRDNNGLPLWTEQGQAQGRGNGSQQGSGACACALTSIATVSGTVDQVTVGVGIQMPALVLNSDGHMLTIKIGPERILDAADFEIKAGDKLTVRYGVTCTDEFVALDLTNSAGVTVVLRNADGSPAWR